MRTTLDIADDVLLAVKDVARRDKRSIGEVISELARSALVSSHEPRLGRPRKTQHAGLARLGIQPLPSRGGIVTNELINQLRDDGIY